MKEEELANALHKFVDKDERVRVLSCVHACLRVRVLLLPHPCTRILCLHNIPNFCAHLVHLLQPVALHMLLECVMQEVTLTKHVFYMSHLRPLTAWLAASTGGVRDAGAAGAHACVHGAQSV